MIVKTSLLKETFTFSRRHTCQKAFSLDTFQFESIHSERHYWLRQFELSANSASRLAENSNLNQDLFSKCNVNIDIFKHLIS